MAGGFIPEIVVSERLDKAKSEIFSHIETNAEAIDANFPTFFGKIATILERAGASISDQVYDDFIDSVVYQVFTVSQRADDPRFVNRVCDVACGLKRREKRKTGAHLAAAIKLLKIGMPIAATTYLRPYWKHDATVGFWYAYCHYVLYKEGSTEPGYSAAERWEYLKSARQCMDELGQLRPRLNLLVRGELERDTWLAEPFWIMIFLATEWLPDNRWFLHTGLLRAKRDQSDAILVKLLQIGLVRFPDDITFYREAYHLKFKQGDLGDTLSFIYDMLEKFPADPEPIYYGLRTSLYVPQDTDYNNFRKLAEESEMPERVLYLIDYGHAVFRGRPDKAALFISELQKRYPSLKYYLDLLQFITSEAPAHSDSVNAAIFTSIDGFCKRVLKIDGSIRG